MPIISHTSPHAAQNLSVSTLNKINCTSSREALCRHNCIHSSNQRHQECTGKLLQYDSPIAAEQVSLQVPSYPHPRLHCLQAQALRLRRASCGMQANSADLWLSVGVHACCRICQKALSQAMPHAMPIKSPKGLCTSVLSSYAHLEFKLS